MVQIPKKLLLSHRRAIGDTIVFTGVVRDIKLTYPQIQIHVHSNYRDVWLNNPHIAGFSEPHIADADRYTLCYSAAINHAEQGNRLHFLGAFHQDFTAKSGLPVELLYPTPDLHLTPEEMVPPLDRRYWVILAGGKSDVTIKHWNYTWYQQVVDMLSAYGIPCVQAGSADRGNTHEPLNNVLNLVGQTNNRSFMRLIYHADGVICPVTSAMHIAAAFSKPAVVIAGGREAWWWEAYVKENTGLGKNHELLKVSHSFLHTIGLLPCCQDKGCWRALVAPITPDDFTSKRMKTMCRDIVREPGQQILPRCMHMITPNHVISEVLMYYEKGVLPPITQARPLPPLPGTHNEVHESPGSPAGPLLLPGTLPTQVPAPTGTAPLQSPAVLGVAAYTPAGGGGNAVPHVRDANLIKPKAPVNAIRLTVPVQAVLEQAASIFDHPIIGGKITVCTLAYGAFPHLVKRCIGSILESVPRSRIDLRIGANACCDETLQYINSAEVGATKVYNHPINAYKYPVMREMFHDPECPIQTNYLVWFDDDSYVVKNSWLNDLAQAIIENHNHKVGMYGIKFIHDIKHYAKDGHDPRHWFQQASWWRGRPFQTNTGGEAPNATAIHFVSGGFWAIYTPLLKLADIPDARLRNNGDMQLGAAMHQHGYKIRDFNRNKTHVYSSGAARRGVQHNFPWSHEQPYERLIS